VQLVELGAVEERHRQQPRVRVHRYQLEPVLPAPCPPDPRDNPSPADFVAWSILRIQPAGKFVPSEKRWAGEVKSRTNNSAGLGPAALPHSAKAPRRAHPRESDRRAFRCTCQTRRPATHGVSFGAPRVRGTTRRPPLVATTRDQACRMKHGGCWGGLVGAAPSGSARGETRCGGGGGESDRIEATYLFIPSRAKLIPSAGSGSSGGTSSTGSATSHEPSCCPYRHRLSWLGSHWS
jgi:hypothetical protein